MAAKPHSDHKHLKLKLWKSVSGVCTSPVPGPSGVRGLVLALLPCDVLPAGSRSSQHQDAKSLCTVKLAGSTIQQNLLCQKTWSADRHLANILSVLAASTDLSNQCCCRSGYVLGHPPA